MFDNMYVPFNSFNDAATQKKIRRTTKSKIAQRKTH